MLWIWGENISMTVNETQCVNEMLNTLVRGFVPYSWSIKPSSPLIHSINSISFNLKSYGTWCCDVSYRFAKELYINHCCFYIGRFLVYQVPMILWFIFVRTTLYCANFILLHLASTTITCSSGLNFNGPFRSLIFKHTVENSSLITSCEITLRWMS